MKQEMQFLEVVGLIRQARNNAYAAVNAELINCYWQVGEYISKRIADASWGDKTVSGLADFISKKHPELKGFNRRGLYRMRQFYETYCGSRIVSPLRSQIQDADNKSGAFVAPLVKQIQVSDNHYDIIVSPLVSQLTDIRETILAKTNWTNHLIIISRTRMEQEREFYLRLSIKENYSKRELDRQISAGLFERTMLGKEQLSKEVKKMSNSDLIGFKDTYVFDFLNLPKEHTETDLQKALIAQMKDFVLELGKDFLFMGEEYRIQVGNSDFVIDLLFYHRGLQCLVAFELKTEKFKPEHLGQLNFYLEALDQDVKKEQENPSIGILLCQGQDREVVRYALNRSMSPALVAAYQMQLPDKEVLQRKWQELFENGFGSDNNGLGADNNALGTDNKKPADLF